MITVVLVCGSQKIGFLCFIEFIDSLITSVLMDVQILVSATSFHVCILLKQLLFHHT